MQNFFFAGWSPIFRIIIIGTVSYIFLLFTLRTIGPRALAKTNVFDFIVAVGIGSTFGRVLTAKEVVLTEACTAFALLVALQYAVSALRFRYKAFARFTDVEPCLLFFNGRFLPQNLASARLTSKDLHEAIRIRGIDSLAEVSAIVFEASGEISVIREGSKSHDLLDAVRTAV
jgi:uncharacterized membrane protein YcaP (DUF421 family)